MIMFVVRVNSKGKTSRTALNDFISFLWNRTIIMSISFPSAIVFIGSLTCFYTRPVHIAFDQPKTRLPNLKIDYGREMLYLRFHCIMVPLFSLLYVRPSNWPTHQTITDCTFPGTMWEKMIINAFLSQLFPSYFHLIFLFLFSELSLSNFFYSIPMPYRGVTLISGQVPLK